MKKTTIIAFLFSILFSTLLSAQTLQEFDLQEISEQQIPLFVDHPNESAYIFYTAINGLTVVSSTGGVVSSQQESTKLTIFLRPERQVLTIKAPGFIEKKIPVESVSAKQAKFFRLNPKEEKYISEKGSFLVDTNPIGCMLKIDGIPSFKQFTPFELKDYEAKKYKINLTKPDYYSLDTLIEIRPGIKQSSQFKLKSKFGVISLKAAMKVTVKFAGHKLEIGTEYTDQKLPEGKYTIEFTDSRFEKYNETIQLFSGETKIIDVPLIKRIGFLRINHPDNFDIEINGVVYSKNNILQTIELYEGKYTASIKRSGLKTLSFSFEIRKGEVVNWEPVFIPFLTQVKLNTEPEGASVILIRNGESEALGFTPIDEQLAVGEVEFLITKEGFKEYKFQEILEEGKALTKTYDLTNPQTNEETVKDIDGNIYHTVTIGTQVWMVENLKTTKYRNGDLIPNVTGDATWSKLSSGAYCNYNNDTNQAKTFGRLYNWYAVNDKRKIAPAGWHIPSEVEWASLSAFVGSTSGTKLKSEKGWSDNGNGTDYFGFTALPGGNCSYNGSFLNVGYYGYWWSSTSQSKDNSWYKYMGYNDKDLNSYNASMSYGFSVRCVKD